MKKTVLAAAMFATVALTTTAMASGEDAYTNFGCAGCHGANGISPSEAYPNLAGQKASYTAKQLRDFQSGDRVDPTMQAMAAMAAGQEDAIAEYISGL
mgnify:CR=1 FL=1